MADDWCKLFARMPHDAAVQEVNDRTSYKGGWLFVAGLCYCAGNSREDGFIPRTQLKHFGMGDVRRLVAVLVSVGLWTPTENGWHVKNWDDLQNQLVDLEKKRQQDRTRAREYRQRLRTADRHVTESRDVTHPEKEEEKDAAAAASAPNELPADLVILRQRLESATVGRNVRWDTLNAAQRAEVVSLIELHGDGPLVDAAKRAYRVDDPPATANAWLKPWRALPAPGERLRVVVNDCDTHPGSPAASCGGCRADRLAGAS